MILFRESTIRRRGYLSITLSFGSHKDVQKSDAKPHNMLPLIQEDQRASRVHFSGVQMGGVIPQPYISKKDSEI